MKKWIFVLLISFMMVSCADTIPVDKCVNGDLYGFWAGVWHGMIVPFSFVGSLFSDDIAIYAINNNGGWYNFGYFMGLGGLSLVIKVKHKR